MQKTSVAGFVSTMALLFCFESSMAQVYPTRFRKISNDTESGITPGFNASASFGIESSAIGDLDDDGVVDLAVGATNQLGTWEGALYILFMNTDGSIKSNVMLTCTEAFGEQDSFGSSICALGDLDDDGVEDIGVGAGYDGDGGYQRGAIWILFMKKDGSVKAQQKISSLQGNFTATLDTRDVFGTGSTAVGDLDGDGNIEMAVGARYSGVVYILYLNDNGTVKSYTTISSADGLTIDMDGLFGYKVAGLGDVDNDGIPDIAIGGHRSNITNDDSGVVYVVFLNASGHVKSFQTLAPGAPGLGGFNEANASILGVGLVGVGDYDNDGVPDMVVGGSDTGDATGAIWYVMLKADGTVKSLHKISSLTGNDDLELDADDFFGASISYLGDINSDGIKDLAIGAFFDDDGLTDAGALWLTLPGVCIPVDAGDDVTVCSTQTVTMNATIDAGTGTGTWTVVQGSALFTDIHDPHAIVSNLGIGENQLQWTISDAYCPSSSIVTVFTEPQVKPDAGEDQTVCEGTTAITISGSTSESRTGRWSSILGDGKLDDRNSPTTTVKDPGIGINKFVWRFLESNYCPETADTVVIGVLAKATARIAMPDTTYTCSTDAVITAIKSDGIGTWIVTTGPGEIHSSDQPETTVSFNDFNKPIHVTWRVTANECPPAEETAVIIPIRIDANTIPNVITPNADNKNERWQIPNIQHIPNAVQLYNRWGEEVLKESNYKNDWSGGNLSPGVYYFLISLTECDKEFKGWLNIIH